MLTAWMVYQESHQGTAVVHAPVMIYFAPTAKEAVEQVAKKFPSDINLSAVQADGVPVEHVVYCTCILVCEFSAARSAL